MKPSILALATLIALSSPAAAGDRTRPGDDAANVRIRLTLAAGESAWPIEALVLDGQRLRTTAGRRVPLPTEIGESSTALSYQDVGMEVHLQVRSVGPGRVRVSGEVELSSIEGSGAGASRAPGVHSFRHVFDVILADGVDTVLAEVPEPGREPLRLTARADLEDRGPSRSGSGQGTPDGA